MTNGSRSVPAAACVVCALASMSSVFLGHAGCAGPSAAGGAAGSIRVAIIFDDTLGQASLGGEAKRGAMLAVEEAGSRAPAVGYFGDAEAGDAAARAVIAVGFTDSDELRAALPAFAAAGTSVVVAGATDPCVARAPGGDALRFACFSDPMQGAAMAEFAHERLRVRSSVVLFDARSEFASAVGSAFTTAMRGLPDAQARVVAFSGDLGPAVASATAVGPDAVYVAALPQDAPRLVRALRNAGFAGAVLGPDSLDEHEIGMATDLGAVHFSTHAWLGARGEPAIESFVDRYRRRFGGEPTAFAALGYDATQIALRAAREAEANGALTRAGIARALDGIAAHEGLSGRIEPAGSERFPAKSVWIIESGSGERRLAARWDPKRVPDPACGKVQ